MVTSNHIHLLVRDTGSTVIAQSMQLVAGCTAQEYNRCKERQGAFWEDRYHATAIEIEEHRHRCLVYIDLNMARAGVVSHPVEKSQRKKWSSGRRIVNIYDTTSPPMCLSTDTPMRWEADLGCQHISVNAPMGCRTLLGTIDAKPRRKDVDAMN
jgi:Transposase IS200 like